MKKYFKDFDVFIPTWVICICMFFWIFGFTFIIGIVLLIKQHFQKRNMFNKLSTLEENNTVKDIEIEEAKKKNECLTKDIKKMEQEKIEYLKHKSEDETQINNISNELEHYKKEIQLIKERIKKYCITEKEIIKRKAAIQKLNEIHQNKINTMEEDFQKKYKI